MSKGWKRIIINNGRQFFDPSGDSFSCGSGDDSPFYLESSDECYYAKEYRPRKLFVDADSYFGSGDNQIIINFKKKPETIATSQGQKNYKIRAIESFAADLAHIIADGSIIMRPITSRPQSHKYYDDRFDRVLKLLSDKRDITIIEPIVVMLESSPLHLSNQRRTIESKLANLKWRKQSSSYPEVFFCDDVISSGSTFKACQTLFYENMPDAKLVGLFWARTFSS